MSTEPTESVKLTLEESGWICHALMQQIVASGGKFEVFGKPSPQLRARFLNLYEKIASANDKLMGKQSC